jgi:LDH2 family malate/lactate/ureidoglycolate dehydrogenase
MTQNPAGERVLVAAGPVAELVSELLVHHGATADNGRQVAEHLVEASAAGVSSHGLMRVPQYLDEIASGEIDPAATPAEPGDGGAGARWAVDGRCTFGQVAGNWAAQRAVGLARTHGLGAVSVHRIGHAGRLSAYVEAAAREGFVALAACSGPPNGHRVAPFGGLEGRMATNPIAYAYPTEQAPVVADFATSASTEGHVRHCLLTGAPAPPDALQDADGHETTDPAALYADPPGTLLGLGGRRYGHKGYALGLLVEALATLTAGDEADDDARRGNNLFLLVMAVDGAFPARAQRMSDYVRGARPAGDGPVQLPGDRERAAAAVADRVAVDAASWSAILAATTRCAMSTAAVDRCLAADGART